MNIKRKIKNSVRNNYFLIRLLIKINRFLTTPSVLREQKFLLKNFKKSLFKNVQIGENNFYLLLDPEKGGVDSMLFLNKPYEEGVTKILLKYLNENSFFIDIGANIGLFTNLGASICKNGKVFAFEPIKKLYNQNLKSIEKNKFNNIELFNFACGSKNERSEINVFPNSIGCSSLVRDQISMVGLNTRSFKEKIYVKKLDDLIKNIKKIDLIKMDIEGFEYFAFLGMKKLLKKFKPKIIFEYSPSLYESIEVGMSKKILQFLSNMGYFIYDIETKKKIVDIEYYLKIFKEDKTPSNLFCIHKNLTERLFF